MEFDTQKLVTKADISTGYTTVASDSFFFNIYYADKPKYICINLTYKIKARKSTANTVVQKNGQSEQLYGNLHASKSKEWN